MKQDVLPADRALFDHLVSGRELSLFEACAIADELSTERLCVVAGALRTHFHGMVFDTCSIMNARSGRCPEDCKWCSQSRHHDTEVEVYPLVEPEKAVAEARHNAAKGVGRFSLVTSGRGMTDSEVAKCCRIYEAVGREVDIYLCASMGLLTGEQLEALYRSGVRRYHCNLETAPSHFPSLCTTHTMQDKIETIRRAQQVGMDVCSGGIIGMGESEHQRIELAVELCRLGVTSIPLNVLNPIPGTRLEGAQPLSDREVVRAAAIMRIVNPRAHIRLAGGRSLIRHLEARLIHCGVSAFITGDMLTTAGPGINEDMETLRKEGFSTGRAL